MHLATWSHRLLAGGEQVGIGETVSPLGPADQNVRIRRGSSASSRILEGSPELPTRLRFVGRRRRIRFRSEASERHISTSSAVQDDAEQNNHSRLDSYRNQAPAVIRRAEPHKRRRCGTQDPQTQDREAATRIARSKDDPGIHDALGETRLAEGPRHRVWCGRFKAAGYGPVRGRIRHLGATVLHQISWRASREPPVLVDGERILEPALGSHEDRIVVPFSAAPYPSSLPGRWVRIARGRRPVARRSTQRRPGISSSST